MDDVRAGDCGPTRRAGSSGGVGVEDLPGVPAGILDMVVHALSLLREKTRGTSPLWG